jgi:hypothetical protein
MRHADAHSHTCTQARNCSALALSIRLAWARLPACRWLARLLPTRSLVRRLAASIARTHHARTRGRSGASCGGGAGRAPGHCGLELRRRAHDVRYTAALGPRSQPCTCLPNRSLIAFASRRVVRPDCSLGRVGCALRQPRRQVLVLPRDRAGGPQRTHSRSRPVGPERVAERTAVRPREPGFPFPHTRRSSTGPLLWRCVERRGCASAWMERAACVGQRRTAVPCHCAEGFRIRCAAASAGSSGGCAAHGTAAQVSKRDRGFLRRFDFECAAERTAAQRCTQWHDKEQRAHGPTKTHTHTHTRARARTHVHTHAHTHTRTHTQRTDSPRKPHALTPPSRGAVMAKPIDS